MFRYAKYVFVTILLTIIVIAVFKKNLDDIRRNESIYEKRAFYQMLLIWQAIAELETNDEHALDDFFRDGEKMVIPAKQIASDEDKKSPGINTIYSDAHGNDIFLVFDQESLKIVAPGVNGKFEWGGGDDSVLEYGRNLDDMLKQRKRIFSR